MESRGGDNDGDTTQEPHGAAQGAASATDGSDSRATARTTASPTPSAPFQPASTPTGSRIYNAEIGWTPGTSVGWFTEAQDAKVEEELSGKARRSDQRRRFQVRIPDQQRFGRAIREPVTRSG